MHKALHILGDPICHRCGVFVTNNSKITLGTVPMDTHEGGVRLWAGDVIREETVRCRNGHHVVLEIWVRRPGVPPIASHLTVSTRVFAYAHP